MFRSVENGDSTNKDISKANILFNGILSIKFINQDRYFNPYKRQ